MESVLQERCEGKTPCILGVGTPSIVGDTVGPFCGSILHTLGYKVVGTIENPLNALNIEKRIAEENLLRQPDKCMICIESAFTGDKSKVGTVEVVPRPLKPGAGLRKDLPEIGDISIFGYVEHECLNSVSNAHKLEVVDYDLVETLAVKIAALVHQAVYGIPIVNKEIILRYIKNSPEFHRYERKWRSAKHPLLV